MGRQKKLKKVKWNWVGNEQNLGNQDVERQMSLNLN